MGLAPRLWTLVFQDFSVKELRGARQCAISWNETLTKRTRAALSLPPSAANRDSTPFLALIRSETSQIRPYGNGLVVISAIVDNLFNSVHRFGELK